MEKKLFISYAIIFFYISERLLELAVNQVNKQYLISKYLVHLRYPKESFQMKFFHSLWFAALILETNWHGRLASGFFLYSSGVILVLSQFLRWYSILSLGRFWSIDIYAMKEHPIIEKGPYNYIRHPNYLAVICEFLFLPLLLGCFWTLVGGAVLNFFILKRRIYLEESSLVEQSSLSRTRNYNILFMHKKRFL